MITAQDLRIGNWLMNDGCPVRVRFINDYLTVTTKQGNDITARLELVKPIPLTPEILIKAGFVHYKDEHTEFWDLRTNSGLWNSFTFTVANFPEDNYKYSGLIFTHHSIRSECKYVHQLQNLFYCLCGEELDVKI